MFSWLSRKIIAVVFRLAGPRLKAGNPFPASPEQWLAELRRLYPRVRNVPDEQLANRVAELCFEARQLRADPVVLGRIRKSTHDSFQRFYDIDPSRFGSKAIRFAFCHLMCHEFMRLLPFGESGTYLDWFEEQGGNL